jgi:two-component system response regulator HydG
MLQVPPLRERPEDIPLLAQEFLVQFAGKNRKTIKGFTPQAMDRLLRHSWPGNVRELMNSVERGVVLSRGEYLDESELSLIPPGAGPSSAGTAAALTTHPEGHSLEMVERETILNVLDAAKGNKSEAARRLGITRRTLHQKLRKYAAT